MTSAGFSQSTGSVVRLITEARRKGVRLWTDGGELHYRAPRGVLSLQDKVELAAASVQIAALLEQSVVRPPLRRRAPDDRAPLTVPQLVHWRTSRLGELPTRRSVSSATRLRGSLDLQLLRESIDAAVRRHEALRTRITTCDGQPIQFVTEWVDYQFEFVDLSATFEDVREAQVEQLIHDLILQPIDVTVGPLLGVRVVQLAPDEHVLITVMEHSISDAFSMNVLMRELFGHYMEAAQGRSPRLPEIPIQFADYAVWLDKLKKYPRLMKQHSDYWRERLGGQRRMRFPEDGQPTTDPSPWGSVPVTIDLEMKADLHEWCRRRHTTIVMAVFTAFVALVLRWCGTHQGIIAYQVDGRASPLLGNTIGYFADVLNVRVRLRDEDSFLDLLQRVTEEYCAAQEHALLSAVDEQFADSDLMRGTGFNWVPQQLMSALAGATPVDPLTLSPVAFTYPMPLDFDSDYEPGVLMIENGDSIEGTLSFPLRRFSVASMTAFASSLRCFLAQLITHPEQPVSSMEMPGRPTGDENGRRAVNASSCEI